MNYINRTYRQVLGKNASDFRSLAPNELKNGLQFYEKLGKMKGQDFTRIVADELAKQPHINSAVSDLIGGLTQNKLAGYDALTYGHRTGYWEIKDALVSESIAHMFEALGSGDVRLVTMQEHFPISWDMFIKYIKRF